MKYEYLTIEDAERLAKNKIDEEIAVEYLNSLKKRAFMTMNEVDLANLVLKYKNELSKEKEKNRKAIEYINRCKNYHKSMHNEEKIYVDEIKELLDILRGEE